ncbi:MAG TPA: MFS transporter [Candidatus Nanoarchaeia archaeon]|nr:MFS transporter [Candidatus Nanoarchaeia archaeon]
MKKDSDLVQRKQAAHISIKEGASSSVMSGLGDSYISAFMVELTKNPLLIGLISSLPGLLSPIAQIYGSRLMEKHPRKKIVSRSALIHGLMWIPIAAIALLFYLNILTPKLPYFLLIAYTSLAILGAIGGPAWFSWMGDIVHEKERGKYFGKRNRIIGFCSLSVFFLASFLLDFFKTKGMVMIAFMIMFLVASGFRVFSYTLFKKKYEPELKLTKDYYFSFWQYITRYGNFLKFSIYQSAFYFSLMISSPFFTYYMLDHLKFSYLSFTLVSISSTLFYLMTLPIAGKFSDKYGNIKMLYVSSLGFALYPLLWLFVSSPLGLILLPQLVIGVSTAGFTIASTNFIYDTVTPQKRGICAAYMSVLVGLGIFVGSMTGGFILKTVNFSWIQPIFFVFIVSAILRFLVTIIFVPKIKERRQYQEKGKLFYVTQIFRLTTGEGRNLVVNMQNQFSKMIPFTRK